MTSYAILKICKCPLETCNACVLCSYLNCRSCLRCCRPEKESGEEEEGEYEEGYQEEEEYEDGEGTEAAAQRPPLILRMDRARDS
tara:strand:+ start:927 stop:1181 length:255 start_codon:yes stop_codon:yes gene_type:complete